ncbi:MAG: hypothetical protein KKE73_05015 [Proteobacteria bacterium]|nr:hypothetical protein [Pseudomonadota bacterium]
MKTLIFSIVLALAAWLTLPAPAVADLVDETRAIAALGEQDPFVLLAPLAKEQAKAAQAAGDQVKALELYRIVLTIDRSDREAHRLASEVKTNLDAQSTARFEQGLAKFNAGEKDSARTDFLASLHLSPDNLAALPYLKEGYTPQVLEEYTIQEGDTLRRISEKIYDNPGGELLLTRINNLSIADALKPGVIIRTPVIDKVLTRRLYAALPAEEDSAKAKAKAKASTVRVTVQESATSSMMNEVDLGTADAGGSGALLAMAKLQLGNGLFETAVSMTDEVLSTDPTNAEASEIRNESYYKLANQLWSKGSASEAMRSLIRLPKGYKDSAKLRKQVEDKLTADSEPLYLTGVKHFLNEDLEKAAEQWELTLQVNPYHAKARADLEKARQLLEAVKGL